MRVKDNTVKIDHLCKAIFNRLDKLDKILNKYSGDNEVIITSGNDGSHSENSFHYSNKAIDIRSRTINKDLFHACLQEIEELFEKKYFDVVVEIDHIHIENDPKVLREEEIETKPGKVDLAKERAKVPDPPALNKPVLEPSLPAPVNEVPKVPWYSFMLQDGFKRSVGLLLVGVGQLFPGAVGNILEGAGWLIGGVGMVHAGKKSKTKHHGEKGVFQVVLDLADLIIKNTLTKRKVG